MRATKMKARIHTVLAKLRESGQKRGPAIYLPEIIRSLESMLDNLDAPQERRARMAGALERLVTEDYSFSESSLGGEILELADGFVSF
jgi:hypothetical protein